MKQTSGGAAPSMFIAPELGSSWTIARDLELELKAARTECVNQRDQILGSFLRLFDTPNVANSKRIDVSPRDPSRKLVCCYDIRASGRVEHPFDWHPAETYGKRSC